MKRQVAIALANSRESAITARRVARATAHHWDLDPVSDELQLLVSELVTNAVIHAHSAVDLRMCELDGGIRVAVGDQSLTTPVLTEHDLDASSGRGLRLLDELSSTWGIDLRDHGKVVWFELTSS